MVNCWISLLSIRASLRQLYAGLTKVQNNCIHLKQLILYCNTTITLLLLLIKSKFNSSISDHFKTLANTSVCHIQIWKFLRISRFISLLVLAQSSLLLSMLYYLLLHVEAFPTADSIHVFEGLVFWICFLAKVQVFFLCGGHPVRITTDGLQTGGKGVY